jgi:hypothetical protein
MKEITINIPDDSSELVIELVERLGGSVDKKEKIKKGVPKSSKTGIRVSNSSNKKKGDPLSLFGKYPDFPLNPKTYRKDLWQRNQKL